MPHALLTDSLGNPISALNPLAVASQLPGTLSTGQAAIVTTGQAVPLSATSLPLINGLVFTAAPSNAGAMTIGGVGVNSLTNGSGNGVVLQPGQGYSFGVNNADLIFINGTAGQWGFWSAN